MKLNIRQKIEGEKRQIATRLSSMCTEDRGPVLSAANIDYEIAGRTRAVHHGGLGLMQLLVGHIKLAEAILKSRPRPKAKGLGAFEEAQW